MTRSAIHRWLCRLLIVLVVGTLAAVGTGSSSQAAPVVQPAEADTVAARAGDSVLNTAFVREHGAKGLELLYNMQFAEARRHFDKIDARYPNHPVGPFLNGLNVWWRILIDLPDTSHDDTFFRAMNETIDRCEEILDEDPDNFDATFFKGAALGFGGRLRSNRGDWFKATLDGKRAIGYVRDVAQQDPDNNDYVFGKGMYDYYAAIIPEEYPISKALMWMLPDGDRERGLRLIRQAANEGYYIQTEAIYFLAQIYYLYENDYSKAVGYTGELRKRHDDNPYFHNMHGRILARWGRWKQAKDVFSEVVDRHAAGQAGYNHHMAEVARYYLARERMIRRDFDGALQHLAALEGLTSREGNTDTKFKALGYLYQGMAYDGQGRRDLAVNRYRMVLRLDDYANTHDQAERYLDDPYGQ